MYHFVDISVVLYTKSLSVAAPGFDLEGGVDFVNMEEGGGDSLKMLTFKVNVIS